MGRADRRAEQVVIDRTACTGHGACAILSAGLITLDEWGYPLQSKVSLDPRTAAEVVTGCPSRAVLRSPPAR